MEFFYDRLQHKSNPALQQKEIEEEEYVFKIKKPDGKIIHREVLSLKPLPTIRPKE